MEMGNSSYGADVFGPDINSTIGGQQSSVVKESMDGLYEDLSATELEHARDLLAWAAAKGGNLLQQAAQMDADCAAFSGGLADKKEFNSPKEMAEHYNACMAKGIAQDQKYFDLYKVHGYDLSNWSVDAVKYDADVKAAKAAMEKVQAELKAAEDQRKADSVKLELRQSIGMVNNWLAATRLLELAEATGDNTLISLAAAKVSSFEVKNTRTVGFVMPGTQHLQYAHAHVVVAA